MVDILEELYESLESSFLFCHLCYWLVPRICFWDLRGGLILIVFLGRVLGYSYPSFCTLR